MSSAINIEEEAILAARQRAVEQIVQGYGSLLTQKLGISQRVAADMMGVMDDEKAREIALNYADTSDPSLVHDAGRQLREALQEK